MDNERQRERESHHALLGSPELLQAFYENSPVSMGITELTADGDILHVMDNAAACRMFDLPVGGTTNRLAVADLGLDPRGVASWIARYRECQRDGRPVHFEHEFPVAQGTRWLSCTVSPLVSGETGRARFCYVADDITQRKQADERLRRNHDTFFNLIQNNPFGIYVVDADFVLTQVSAGAQKVFASVRPLLGRDFADVLRIIWPDPFASQAIKRFEHTLDTGEPYAAPSTVETRADIGQTEAYDWRIERIDMPDGRYGVVCYFYDLSDRQRWESALREGEERLRMATQAAELGIWLWDPDLDRVVWENSRPYELLGLPVDSEPVNAGRFAAEFLVPEYVPAFNQVIGRTVERNIPFWFEGRVRRVDGKEIWIEITGTPTLRGPGQRMNVIGTIRDITERKQTEKLLRDADRRKDEFLATLAHELRNPLAPVKNAMELMKSASHDSEVIHQARETIERQVGQMVRLIDDLLDVSRITTDKLELKKVPVVLSSIVQYAVESCRPNCDRDCHTLHVELPKTPIYLNADPVRLVQVLGNILSNSCKYTAPGGQIRLTVQQQGSEVEIHIKDNGVGIPTAKLPSVFEMFTQLDNSLERSAGGLGIGLSLVKRLVEMHQGSVMAHSEGAGQGSEFIVRLPVTATPVDSAANASTATGIQSATPHSRTVAGRRILVVDDNVDAAKTLAMLLKLNGSNIQCAHDGIEAIDLANRFKPEVMLLDIGLPKKNGYDVCREVRSTAGGESIVIVALTGWGQEDDRRKSQAAGFDGHMVKPVDLRQLLEWLDQRLPS